MAVTESRQPSTVAVVIPTYNRRDLVVQAVQSVLGQSHRDLSCLVIDNGSTDGTAEALAAIKDPRLKVLSEGSPLGGPAARNVGIAAAKGAPWVAFLDSDDVWAPRSSSVNWRASPSPLRPRGRLRHAWTWGRT